MISFYQLIDGGDKDGARAKFERLIAQLVSLQYQGVKIVSALRGDWGLDVIVGEVDDVLSVWQAKFFIDGIGEAQKSQIRESFKTVMEKAAEKGFTVNVWTLCIPIDLDPGPLVWWTGWMKRKEREHGVRIELWHRTRLETILLAPDAERILAAYFPNVAVPALAADAVLDDRPISVLIDRSPEWHNFDFVAWILHLHVVVSNHTDGRKEVQGYVWLGGGVPLLNPKVQQEVQRRERDRPHLLRHSVLEPGLSESGWIIRAFPYTGGQPPDFTFGVKVEGEIYEALRP